MTAPSLVQKTGLGNYIVYLLYTPMPTPALAQTLLQPLHHLRSALAAIPVESLARRTGFLRRRPRKIPVVDLVLAFCALGPESALSLERIAAVVGLAARCRYSKQALHQRLSQTLEGFLQAV